MECEKQSMHFFYVYMMNYYEFIKLIDNRLQRDYNKCTKILNTHSALGFNATVRCYLDTFERGTL